MKHNYKYFPIFKYMPLLLSSILILYLTTVFSKDNLIREMPDKYDLKLSKIDEEYLNRNISEVKTDDDLIFENSQRLENQASTLKNFLDIDNVYSLTSSHLWEKIYKYIIDHLNEFLENNQLSFKMYIRYNFCLFVIPLLPTDYFVVFPSFYKYIIPYKYRNTKIFINITDRIDKFLKEIKSRKTKEILTVFYIKRSGTVMEDIEMIKMMPLLIRDDPMKILRWIVDFKAEII